MSAIPSETTNYHGNTAGGNAIAFMGPIHGSPHFHGIPGNDQCLRDLFVTDPREDKVRIEKEKDTLLNDCYAWILRDPSFQRWRMNDESKLLWIKGDPGKGKTMMMIGIVNELLESGRAELSSEGSSNTQEIAVSEPDLVSFFFCQSTRQELSNAVAVVRGLIYLLTAQKEGLMRHVRRKYEAAGRKMFEGPNAIYALRGLLSDIAGDPDLPRTVFLVDALDECNTGLSELLDVINSIQQGSKVKWLVTSRNLPNIERVIGCTSAEIESHSKISLELNHSHISYAVRRYIDFKVDQLSKRQNYDEELRNTVIEYLRSTAEDTFLWVALVCKELEKVESWETKDILSDFPSGLPPLYNRMMGQVQAQNKKTAEFSLNILYALAFAFRPLKFKEVVSAAGLPEKEFRKPETLIRLIEHCGSFLTWRDDTIYFVHQSAKDYLMDPERLDIFRRAESDHRNLALRLLRALHVLKKDLCDINDYGPVSDSTKTGLKFDPLEPIGYACCFWIDHLCALYAINEGEALLIEDGEIHRFFQQHFLHWLESLSLLGKVSDAVRMIVKLHNLILSTSNSNSRFADFLRDAEKFIVSFGSIIELAPLQVYSAALAFAPVKSEVKMRFWGERLQYVKSITGILDYWEAGLQTLEGHSHWVHAVAFSPDGKLLASGSDDETVRLWDAATGAARQTLEGHSDSVNAVAFSPDGKLLASGSHDETVRLWDATTGAARQTLEGHSSSVNAVIFSPDGKLLASGSDDKAVRLWDAATGAARQTYKADAAVSTLSFSSDGPYIETNRGRLHGISLYSSAVPSPLQVIAHGIIVEDEWIVHGVDRMLWLPPKDRPSCSAVHGSVVAFGHHSGRVLIFVFTV